MADERDELTPSQLALNITLELNEASYALLSAIQQPAMCLPEKIGGPPVESCPEPLAEVVDKVCAALADLFHLAGRPDDLERLADAAARWVRGDA